MRTLFLIAAGLAAAAGSTCVLAQRASPYGIQPSARDEALIEQVQKERAAQTQAQIQKRYDDARQNCIANHGVDCDTDAGLQEWLLLERSRAEAVFDRLAPPAGSASTGASGAARNP